MLAIGVHPVGPDVGEPADHALVGRVPLVRVVVAAAHDHAGNAHLVGPDTC